MTLTASTPDEADPRMKTALAYRPDVIKIFTDGWRYGAAPNLTSMNLEPSRPWWPRPRGRRPSVHPHGDFAKVRRSLRRPVWTC